MKGFDDHLDNYGDPNPGDDDEPPFDENHYRYHTPAGPNPACPNCKWLNWQQEESE